MKGLQSAARAPLGENGSTNGANLELWLEGSISCALIHMHILHTCSGRWLASCAEGGSAEGLVVHQVSSRFALLMGSWTHENLQIALLLAGGIAVVRCELSQ